MPKKSTRKFIQALRRRKPSLIAEVKPMSPSKGILVCDDEIDTIVKLYSESADAISALCDTTYFGGGYDLLARIRARTHLPILAKEFIIDTKQILCARESGADAILLIASLLTEQHVRQFSALAQELGMAILFEIHTKKDVDLIPSLDPEHMIIGINNRNLETLEITRNATTQLAPMIRKKYPEHMIISESGISSVCEAEELMPLVDAFLIGSGILMARSPQEFLQSFSLLSHQ